LWLEVSAVSGTVSVVGLLGRTFIGFISATDAIAGIGVVFFAWLRGEAGGGPVGGSAASPKLNPNKIIAALVASADSFNFTMSPITPFATSAAGVAGPRPVRNSETTTVRQFNSNGTAHADATATLAINPAVTTGTIPRRSRRKRIQFASQKERPSHAPDAA
jgi:hypothetical protein